MDKLGPPPKSLTVAANLDEKCANNGVIADTESTVFGYGCKNRLDEQLMKLRREMVGLRQLDMSLLSQLDALRKSILDCKMIVNRDHSTKNDIKNVNGFEEEITDDEQEEEEEDDDDDDDDDEKLTSSDSTV